MSGPTIASWIARSVGRVTGRPSAAVLLSGGLALLFGADVLLPMLAPAPGPEAGARVASTRAAETAWIGQLLGAAWLGPAALNWLSRDARLGGIHGRPVVLANLVLYVVSAMTALRALRVVGVVGWTVAGPALVLVATYAALLLPGPFDEPG